VSGAGPLQFAISARCARSKARVGRITTPHGTFDTPAFMPVGTRATVKGILPSLLAETGAQICLANTYHLLLRPGEATIAALGGLQKVTGWQRPMLTDSGGYQAFSMADLNSVTDDGVTFKSIVDGAAIHLNPERAVAVQNALGADIIMAFDDCPPSENDAPADEAPPTTDPSAAPRTDARLTRALRRDGKSAKGKYDHGARLKIANERTARWLKRCKAAHARPHDQALFGIVQGGTDLAMRDWSAHAITNIDLPGYAIGGVAVGEGSAEIAKVVRHTAPLLPDAKPRYLMGVGYERDIVAAVLAGIDMFDCVLPTRNGRNANAFTPTGQIRLRNAKYAHDTDAIQPGCDCHACRTDPTTGVHFSRGYLRHLFGVNEMLGPILVTLHNLRHFQRLTADLRATIVNGDWPGFVTRWPICAQVVTEGLTGNP